MSAARRRERGFTLLEVVVAIALFAMLMTLVYNVLSTAARAFEAGQTRTSSSDSRRVISEFLRASLTAAFPIAVGKGQKWSLLFDGGDGRLRYVADLPGYVGVGGLHEIVIERERLGADDALVMRRRPLVLDDRGEVSGDFDSRVLLDQVNDFQVRFFGSEEDDQEPDWRDAWPAGQRMPMLVELAITDADDRPWPALWVRPRVNVVRHQGAGSAPGTGGTEEQQAARGAPLASPPADTGSQATEGVERTQ
jgi:general secretion pathway protein J